MPPKFFITHSWKDIEFAKRLCNDLSAHGLDGFFDAYSIQPGDLIAAHIAHGLEECDVYVPLLSPAAVESPWCEREIGIAIDLSMERERNGRPRIVPVLIKPCKQPTILRGILYISFDGRYDEAFNELLTKGFGVAPPAHNKPNVVVPPAPAPRILAPPRAVINPKDGEEMILIPAGEFQMGSDERDNEKPPHNVFLDAFYIDRYPVTNAEYKKFVDATKHSPPDHWINGKMPLDKENHPVVRVTWDDAVAYAEWAGGCLPTEAEWEKAASWDEAKKEKRRYPWGNDFDKSKCNTKESGIDGTTPVGKYSPQGDSAYGIGDMAGNVLEWCSNTPQKYPYRADDGREDLVGNHLKVLRGGSWFNDRDRARCAYRGDVRHGYRDYSTGFRLAESVSS